MARRKADGESSGVGPFFSRLRELLDAQGAQELRARLVEYARRLDRPGREALLRALEAPRSAPPAGATGEDAAERAALASDASTPAAPDPEREADRLAREPLLAEIDAFAERVENHHYAHGWGWDPEIRAEREFGDESWAPEMDALFADADEAFLSGDRPLAAEAYGALLETFLLDEEAGTFCGPVSATEMVETDVERAKARYFRCLYELADPERRPARLLRAMEELRWVGGGEVGLEAVADADAGALPEFDSLLEAWSEALDKRLEATGETTGYGRSRDLKWLRREAAELQAGEAGLADLARRHGATDPEAYHEWIDRLLEENRPADALRAARSGVEAVEEPVERARLADLTAALARKAGEPEQTLEACRAAWRAHPTGPRLLALAGALTAPAAGTRAADVESGASGARREAEGGLAAGLRAELARLREGSLEAPGRVAAALELLAGDFEAAVSRLEEAPPLGWSGGDHPGYVVFPFLLEAGTTAEFPRGTAAASYLEDLDREAESEGLVPSSWVLDRLRPESDLEARLRRDAAEQSPRFTELLRRAVKRRPPAEGEHRALLATAESVARNRVEAIVSNKHRDAYERAARVATASAEAWQLAGNEDRAAELLTGLRSTFSRYYAFTRELRKVVKGSPVVRGVATALE